ncbi:MAG: nucleotide exchange factor GrpE [Acidobacteria bacterium]|nr:nucleotide exchange factor GrpE [Acidobacteriota bacterium]MBV9069302.1 nucleotide exchange factor GrpE [Acidobacteriota bacterium]MBV9184819.1 nucleotide exchange factor GrpE [Acidobacteriota bacterium]
MSENQNDANDDAYVIEDTGESVAEIEQEMEATAQEAISGTPAAAPQNEDFRDRYMRTLADFENFRKRSEREKADFQRYALGSVIRDLLPVLDNFDRALEHAEEGDEFHKGVSLIYKQLFDVLQRHGLKPIAESGVRFDPNFHEAVIREEDPSVPSHTVTAVLQKGYFLHDRLLRPAMVKVAVGGPEEDEPSGH